MDRDGTLDGLRPRADEGDLGRSTCRSSPPAAPARSNTSAAGLDEGEADAVLAASIFHYGTYSIAETKAYLAARGIHVRPPAPGSGAD